MLKQWLKKDRKIIPIFLVSFILPCLFCWLMGNLYIEQIPFGVVDLDHSPLSRQIIRGMTDHPGLAVQVINDKDILEDEIFRKNICGGMVIPENFNKELTEKRPKLLLTFIDGTNTQTSNNIMAYVSAITGTYGAGVTISMLEGNGMSVDAAVQTYNTFQYVERTLYDPYLSCLSYLIYFMVPFLLQLGVVCLFALPMFSELHQDFLTNGWRVLSISCIAEIAVRCLVIYLLSVIFSWGGYCLADYYFGLPMRGTMFLYVVLVGAFELALLAASFMLATFIKPHHRLYFMDVYIILGMAILLTSGAIWPIFLMPKGLFEIIRSVWPFAYVAVPFKLLNLKGSGWNILGPVVGNCLQYAAFWVIMALIITLFKRLWFRKKNKGKNAHSIT